MNSIEIKRFESHAKLMISGEYMVLKGALSLALPLKYGQTLTVEMKEGKSLIDWNSLLKNEPWFTTTLLLPDFSVVETNSIAISATLCSILAGAKSLNPNFLDSPQEYHVLSTMDFLPEWGVGSSSTLVSNIAYWADCDPFELNSMIFQGSGYDIACARSTSPIIYEFKNAGSAFRKANFHPSFEQQLYFIYLNRKQNSKKSINSLDMTRLSSSEVKAMTELTLGMEMAGDLKTFQTFMDNHEELVGKAIRKIPIRELYFDDFCGSLKSLGAWGGDFVLAASDQPEEYVRNYFQGKELQTIFKYSEIVLQGLPDHKLNHP